MEKPLKDENVESGILIDALYQNKEKAEPLRILFEAILIEELLILGLEKSGISKDEIAYILTFLENKAKEEVKKAILKP